MGGARFLFGDADLSPEGYRAVEPQILAIGEKYGRRDHLISEIAEYLVSIGRYAPPRQSLGRRVLNGNCREAGNFHELCRFDLQPRHMSPWLTSLIVPWLTPGDFLWNLGEGLDVLWPL
jgi:hypothetical protein